MKYKKIVEGLFLSRPNRFIAYVLINGNEEKCHVKNTGRCKELLIPNITKVYLEDCKDNPTRKTRYSLIAVEKETQSGNIIINMDSQAPNQVVKEWLQRGGLGFELSLIKPEKQFEDSRFDFYFEYYDQNKNLKKAFMEVKGVTLENEGVVRFPDAPTERGSKHIEGLIRASDMGYETYVMFVVQMEHFIEFHANKETDIKFANTLNKAIEKGVNVIVKSCNVGSDFLEVK